MTEALKPCPFCGEAIEITGSRVTRDIKKAIHPTNDCLLSGQIWWHVPRFIKPWNIRADLVDPAAIREEAAQKIALAMKLGTSWPQTTRGKIEAILALIDKKEG